MDCRVFRGEARRDMRSQCRHVYQFAGIWCLDIRLDNRGEHGSLKNLGSERKVPLHPAVIEEGFLKYVAKLPKNGPLFPNLTPDRYGKRGGSGSKRLCRW